MAQWVKVTQKNCPAMFAEAVGAWSLQVHHSAIASVIANDTIHVDVKDPKSSNLFTDDELQTQVRNYFDNTVASLGLYSFVYPFERYNKLIAGKNLDINVAFGLDYADQATFVQAYPRVVINTFTPMMDAGGAKIRSGWLSSMIRNSFAHGQTHIRTDFAGYVGVKRIWIWNKNMQGVVTFDVHMDIKDFVALAAEALETFIALVVETGKYQPLSKMLDYELHREVCIAMAKRRNRHNLSDIFSSLLKDSYGAQANALPLSSTARYMLREVCKHRTIATSRDLLHSEPSP